MSGCTLRELSGMQELRLAERLQREVWGAGDKEDPADLMMVIQREGGLVAGAFDGARLVGYLFAFPTRDVDTQHSHRLAVHASYRGRGLGAALKWFQRDWCLARDIVRVRWTFDPLRHVNARLNVDRLGAFCRTYYVDYYAEMGGINAGVPSDRLLAEWHLQTPTVIARAAGGDPPLVSVAHRVVVPADFEVLLRTDPEAANRERLRVRSVLGDALGAGLVVRGYDAAAHTYLLAE